MSVRRLATPESIAAALVRILPAHGGALDFEAAVTALQDDDALHFAADADDADIEGVIVDAIDYAADAADLLDLGDHLVHPATLLGSKVFTHRITADDVSGEVITLFPDCAALLYALEPTAAAPHHGEAAPTADGGTDVGDDISLVMFAVGDDAPRPVEVVGLRSIYETDALLLLPEGTLATAGLGAGDLVALSLHDSVLHFDAVTEQPELDEATVTRLREVKDESMLPDSLGEFVMRCIIAEPTLFERPGVPLTELLDAAGIHPRADGADELSPQALAAAREQLVAQTATHYDIKTHEARLLHELLDHFDDRTAAEINLEPDLARRAAAACGDPWFAYLLGEEAVGRIDSSAALAAFAAAPPIGASRAVRSGLLYLQARVWEAAGDVVAAVDAYRKCHDLQPSSYALRRLATIDFYRGAYDSARSLLDQSGAGPDFPLYEQIERANRHTLPAEPTRKLGRNEPCWCGAGRKFKVCHGRATTGAPLSHRAPGLYDRAVGFVMDTSAADVLGLLTLAEATAGTRVPEGLLLPMIVDCMLIEDHLMGAFAEQYADILPDDELLLLEQWHFEATRSVFDVEECVPGESMTLRDLRTGDRCVVTERSGSQQVQPGWFLLTRVADVAGELQTFGGIEPIPLDRREDLLDLLDSSPTARDLINRHAARLRPPQMQSPEGDPLVFCEARYDVADPTSLRATLTDLFGPASDGADTGASDGGDDAVPVCAVAGAARGAVGGAVAGAAGGAVGGAMARGPGDAVASAAGGAVAGDAVASAAGGAVAGDAVAGAAGGAVAGDAVAGAAGGAMAGGAVAGGLDNWDWTEPLSPDQHRVLASMELVDDELVIRTSTEERLERVLGLLDEAGADLIETEVDRSPAAEMVRAAREDSLDPADEVGLNDEGSASGATLSMAEVAAEPALAEALASMIATHEQRWLDEPIPALSGFTPRQAAADPTRRDDLIRLLKERADR